MIGKINERIALMKCTSEASSSRILAQGGAEKKITEEEAVLQQDFNFVLP